MGYITLKGLDFMKMRNWIKIAVDKRDSDPIFSFISAWIGFNYYYFTFAKEHEKDFITWDKEHFHGRRGDKSQLLFLVSHDDLKKFFNKFRENNTEIFEAEVDLPIKKMIGGDPVPKNLKGRCKLKDLTIEQIFSVVYQIRNNLFHGAKDPKKNERDKTLSTFACNFIVPFLEDMIKNTYGEVISNNE